MLNFTRRVTVVQLIKPTTLHISKRFMVNWASLGRFLKMNVKVESEGNKAVVSIPAFTFHEFDRTGKVNVLSIQKWLTAARFAAYHTPNPKTGHSFLQYDTVTADRYTFMASTSTQFDAKLFELNRRAENQPDFKIALRLGYVGKSSLNSVAELYCKKSGHVYATNTNQVVMVDKSTRKPTTIPQWWKEKYGPLVTEGVALVVPLVDVPDTHHTYDVKVPWTDIDRYKHNNYTSYIRYCQDAALDACYAGKFSQIKGDFLEQRVKNMSVSYKGESVANDRLTVHVWENAEDAYKIHFSINKNGAVIFQNTLTLFRPETPAV